MFVGQNPDPAILNQLLRYDAETGKLFWLQRSSEMFKGEVQTPEHCADRWNSRCAGQEALSSITARGYRAGKIFGRMFYAHRVIWAMQTGEWPSALIDHKDTDRSNNRWDNLRQATPSQNQHNKRLTSANSSGIKGVSRHKRSGKWQANISLHGKQKHLGVFDSIEQAEHRVNAARCALHLEYGRTV